MVKKILMPALSPTMSEGNIVKWSVKEGDSVSVGDVIAEIETDKSTLELESVDEGKIGKIILEEGSENIKVNSVIALLLEDEDKDQDLESYLNSSDKESEAEGKKASGKIVKKDIEITEERSDEKIIQDKKLILQDKDVQKQGERLKASPVAKKIAREEGIDLSSIEGTGFGKRIIKKDVLELGRLTSASAEFEDNKNLEGEYEGFNKIIKMTSMRKSIARRLTESKRDAPHFYVDTEVRMCSLMKIRENINQFSEVKITINDFIVKAVASAMTNYPLLNSFLEGDNQIIRNEVNISIAVSVDNGLVVPVLRNADKKSIKLISEEIKFLIAKSKEKKLKPEDSLDGGITISNMGMFGVRSFSAIINPPQSGILAVGSSIQKPCVIDGEIKIANMCILTFSVDHRIIDGVLAAQFLMKVKNLLENPLILLSQ